MARKARGRDLLEQAKWLLSKAKTAEELRQAQAVVIPLEFCLSIEQTARAIGVSTGSSKPLPRQKKINWGVVYFVLSQNSSSAIFTEMNSSGDYLCMS